MLLKDAKEQLAIVKRYNKKEIEAMVKSTKRLAKSLKNLDKEQIAALVTLVLLTEGTLRACVGMPKFEKRTVLRLTNNLKAISPKLQYVPRAILESSRGGKVEEAAYYKSVFRCGLIGKAETKCPEAVAAKARWMRRMSDELALVKNRVNLIWERLGLPDSKPLPI